MHHEQQRHEEGRGGLETVRGTCEADAGVRVAYISRIEDTVTPSFASEPTSLPQQICFLTPSNANTMTYPQRPSLPHVYGGFPLSSHSHLTQTTHPGMTPTPTVAATGIESPFWAITCIHFQLRILPFLLPFFYIHTPRIDQTPHICCLRRCRRLGIGRG